MVLDALFTLAFAPPPCQKHLSSHHTTSRWGIMQKARHYPGQVHRAVTACKSLVSGTLSLPARGTFQCSLALLSTIGLSGVFSLGGWSPHIHARLHGTGATREFPRPQITSCTGLSPPTVWLSNHFQSSSTYHIGLRTPRSKPLGLGSSVFARRYLRNLV